MPSPQAPSLPPPLSCCPFIAQRPPEEAERAPFLTRSSLLFSYWYFALHYVAYCIVLHPSLMCYFVMFWFFSHKIVSYFARHWHILHCNDGFHCTIALDWTSKYDKMYIELSWLVVRLLLAAGSDPHGRSPIRQCQFGSVSRQSDLKIKTLKAEPFNSSQVK